MKKIATIIVDKRNIIFLFYIIACIFCVFSMNWVKVENQLSAYLLKTAETSVGLDIMDKEFVTLGSAKIMVDNVTYEQAEEISKEIENKDYVSSVAFDDSEEHYHNVAAMFEVTFIYPEKDEACVKAQGELLEDLSAYDLYVSSSVGDTESETLAAEMQKIIVVVAIVIIAVLLFTSKTYAEVPVLLLTFGSAALLNMGTNYWFGTISFISNSVTVVLQLALAIDYAVILCNHFTEEHELLPTREACIEALNKSIPEISSSCLTTVSGLLALCFMQFRIGQDLGVVLVKAIMFSIMSVFLLMPGLLMVFSKLMDKTRHKNFVPKITFIAMFHFHRVISGTVYLTASDNPFSFVSRSAFSRSYLRRI